MSLIPVFELNKDSYILKHKLNYNTNCENEWSGVTYGILFTDYDLARKTQSKNAEVFSGITISENINDIVSLKINHYGEEYELNVDSAWKHTELVLTGNTIGSGGATFMNDGKYQLYYIPPGDTSKFSEGDIFNIYFHDIIEITGNIDWTHFGPSGETWIVTGTTENGISYQVTGTTTINGFSSGTTTYTVNDIIPILKYRATSVEIGSNYVKFDKKVQDYIYNTIIKSSIDYNTVSYTIESLNYSDGSFHGIKYILEETKWGKYFDIIASDNDLIINPIPNKEDLYFDYDNIIITLESLSTLIYTFDTNCLYVKYKLDEFLYQLNSGFNSGTIINYDNSCTINNISNNNITLNTISDIEYFTSYTYVNVNSYLCLITSIDSDNGIISVMPPTGVTLSSETSIQNLNTIEDISNILYSVYVNIDNFNVDGYRKLNEQQRKNIYYAYSFIIQNIDINSHIRSYITGILYENENKVFTLKIYKPSEITDSRLTYIPTEIVKIGINNKTTIPIKIFNTIKIDKSLDEWNVLDINLYNIDEYNSNIFNPFIIISNYE